MKSEAAVVESSTPKNQPMDLQPRAMAILKTMIEFGRAYGQNYVAQFVTGDRFLSLRKPEHRSIETLGLLRRTSLDDIFATIQHLVDVGYISVSEPDFITISITDSGRAWVEQPNPWLVSPHQVRYSNFEKFLRNALRLHRNEVAARFNLKAWEVISDYAMDRIVLAKPLDLDALSRVQGFDTRKCEQFGTGFVKTVQEVIEHFDVLQRASLMVRVKRGSYPRVKKMFEDNVTVPEIAHTLTLQLNTVCTYLRELHEANEIDLVPWIERNINAKSLFKGVEYFERVSRPTLKEAYNALGLDYNTLLFCRLYARDKRMRKQEEAMLKAAKPEKMAS